MTSNGRVITEATMPPIEAAKKLLIGKLYEL